MQINFTSYQALIYSRQLLSVKSFSGFATILAETADDLQKVIAAPKYHSFSIPKKSGGKREVLAPDQRLKYLQKRLNVYLQCVYLKYIPDASHGFILSTLNSFENRGICTNAKVHVGKNYVTNLDIKDFFHSISTTRVRDLFLSHPFSFPEDVARAIALLCCYQKKLPVGCPTSPVIANMVAYSIDRHLQMLCDLYSVRYSRYADDITISSYFELPDTFIKKARSFIKYNGFRVNEKKFRIQSKYTKQVVTGLKVNEIVNVDRKYVRNIRAILHDWRKNGVKAASEKYLKSQKKLNESEPIRTFQRSVQGKIEFIGMVKGKTDGVYLGLIERFYYLKI